MISSGTAQRGKGLCVRLHQCFQFPAQGLSPGVQGLDVRFHSRVFLFAGGQTAHHIAQCDPGGTHQRRRAAAARDRGFARQFCQELGAALFHHFHV